jgi:hypothetical protein
MTNGTYPWLFLTLILRNVQPSHGDDLKAFEVMTSNLTTGNPGFSS